MHILQELGLDVSRVGDEVHGAATVEPVMWVPGTNNIRTSVLAAWADTVAGHLAMDHLLPRVPVTLELDVHVLRERPIGDTVRVAARTVKAGRSVVVLDVDFTDGDGEPLAVGSAGFMVAPDPDLSFPYERLEAAAAAARPGPMAVPFAERARCEVTAAGVAALPWSEDGLNASGSINGGLLALAVEEAALSLTPGATLASIALRYLRPVRTGPAVATAVVRGGLGRVEVRDAGNDDRLAVLATTRTFG
jgi:acyl-coenzyme A thioesterase PaaI-like protein